MKYQKPKLYPMNKFFFAYAVCVAGEQAAQSSGCLTGVSAGKSACSQGVHPGRGCTSGTLPGNDCATGAGDGEW
ncbi:MAG: hypothetical protein KOO69_07380 [Victivallales bacterium]|nr:hypothetical protein [Victivallales bacterium]